MPSPRGVCGVAHGWFFHKGWRMPCEEGQSDKQIAGILLESRPLMRMMGLNKLTSIAKGVEGVTGREA